MIKKSKEFYEDVVTEMKKVNWPAKDDLVNSTFVVFVISALFTLFIFFSDQVFSYIINLFY